MSNASLDVRRVATGDQNIIDINQNHSGVVVGVRYEEGRVIA